MKDSPEAKFPSDFTISWDSKIVKQICKRKYALQDTCLEAK